MSLRLVTSPLRIHPLTTRRELACFLALLLLIVLPVCAAIEFHGPPMIEGKDDMKGCYFSSDVAYQAKLKALSNLALGEHEDDGKLGCVTYPYVAGQYDVGGSLKILNDVHAGIDLRARTSSKVFAIDGGTVVYQNLCVTTDKQKSEGKCLTKDGKQHSTLIVENEARSHKILYLHLSTHDEAISINALVKKGATLGFTGAVGTDTAHLHIEVWTSTAPQYCARQAALAGSACAGKPKRTLWDKSTTVSYCELADVLSYTVDPAEALEELALTSPMEKTLLTVNTPLLLRSFGPIIVGATAIEAAKAIGSPLIGDLSTVGCGYMRPRYGPGGVSFMMIDGRVARIEIDSCQLKTRSGAKIGDVESVVKKLYPGIEINKHAYDDNGHYLTFIPKDAVDSEYRLLFESDGKKVTTMRAGRMPEIEWVEGCF